VFDDQGVLVAGTIPNTRPTTNTRYGEQKKETTDLSFNVQYALNDSWALTGDLQFIESHAEVTSLTAFSQLGGAPLGTMDFDLRGDDPSMRLNNSAQDDPNAYWWAAAMDHLEDNDATSKAARLDAEYAFNDNPWLHSFQVGVRATDREAVTRQTGWNWGYLSQQFWCIGCGAPAFLGSGPAGTAEMFTFDNFFRGDVGRPGVAWTPSANLVKSGRNNAYELLRATQGAGWGWVPLTGEYDNLQLHADNGNRGINDQTERTEAAYAMIRFENDGWRVPIDGNVGVRAVHTDTSTLATPGVQARAGNSTTTNDPNAACDPSAEDCTWWNNATSFVGAFGSLQNAAVDSSYTDVLPTMNLRFLLQPELQLRFAAGKAIVRPTFSQMQGSTLLTFDNTGFQPTAGVANDGMVGYGGNPNLKPTRATQFDTSLEWYFAPTGSATFAMFFKDVRDYIFAGQGLETYSAGGQEVEFLVTRNMNGAKGRIRGFEAAYQQFYDWLPGPLNGLGFQANFTYVDSSGGKNAAVTVLDANQVAGANNEELPLEGLSRTSYNVALMYEKSAVSARLAYNWRERYLLTTSAANINRPVWFEDFGQLDGSVFYSITPNVKLGLQGTNLLNTRTFLDVGGTTLAPRYSWTDTDRKIAVAIRTSF
jgi:TonB-dependent receptor